MAVLNVEFCCNAAQAVRWKIKIIARHKKRIDQVGDLDLMPDAAKFAVQKLQVELGVMADNDRFLKERKDLAGDLMEGGSGCQLGIFQTVGARRPGRERSLGIYKLLVRAPDALPFGDHNPNLANTIPEPGRKTSGFQVKKGKTRIG